MFDNIDEKIKLLAIIIFAVGAFTSIIMGIFWLFNNVILLGIIAILIGPLIALAFSWILYGFGELIEKTTSISNKLHNSKSDSDTTIPQEEITQSIYSTPLSASGIMDIPKRKK